MTEAFWKFCWRGFGGLLLVLAGAGARADIDLVFGVYAADHPSTVARQFRPLLDRVQTALSQRMGQPVRIRIEVAASYEEGIVGLRAGKVAFARLGPASYVVAKQGQPDLRLLAMETSNGEKTFLGAIVVRANSPIHKIEDLKGHAFAFGDEYSTIGRYLAQHLLLRNGVAARDLSHYAYLGRHDAVGEAVASGRFDAGALKQGTVKQLAAQGKKLHPLAIFRNITKPWVAHPSMPEPLFQALGESLLAQKDEQVFEQLALDGTNGFAPAEDAEFDPIRTAMKRNAEFFR